MEVVLTLLVLQFLLAAVAWIGSVPLPRFRLASGPGWLQVELTRIVLPLLMIVAGLLFFSRPLAPTWGPALGLETFSGFPTGLGRWAFLLLNLGAAAVLVGATGGTPRSPFAPLLPTIPLLGWAAGVTTAEFGVGMGMAGLLLWLTRGAKEGEPEEGPVWNQVVTGFLTLAVFLIALFLGGRIGG